MFPQSELSGIGHKGWLLKPSGDQPGATTPHATVNYLPTAVMCRIGQILRTTTLVRTERSSEAHDARDEFTQARIRVKSHIVKTLELQKLTLYTHL